jgi:hypothetical protein
VLLAPVCSIVAVLFLVLFVWLIVATKRTPFWLIVAVLPDELASVVTVAVLLIASADPVMANASATAAAIPDSFFMLASP